MACCGREITKRIHALRLETSNGGRRGSGMGNGMPKLRADAAAPGFPLYIFPG